MPNCNVFAGKPEDEHAPDNVETYIFEEKYLASSSP